MVLTRHKSRFGLPEEASADDDGEIIVIRTTEAKLKEAERQILEIQNKNEVPASLGNLEAAAAAFQFIQAAILFVAASQSDKEWNWYTSYPTSSTFTEPHPTKIATFSILYYSPIYIAISGFGHLASLLFRESFTKHLELHQNPYRWTEYTFSAALMRGKQSVRHVTVSRFSYHTHITCYFPSFPTVLVAQLVGVTDIHILLSIFVMTMVTIQCGATFEATNAKARADGMKKQWNSFFTSWIAQLASWFIIFNYFGVSVAEDDGEAFLWGVVLIFFLLDCSFALIFYLQWAEIEPFDSKCHA